MEQHVHGRAGGPYEGLDWNGKEWVGGRGADVPDAKVEYRGGVRAYYWLGCYLPCLLAIAVPIPVGIAMSYPAPGGTSMQWDQHAMVVVGWAFYGIALVAAAFGWLWFDDDRAAGDPSAVRFGNRALPFLIITGGVALLGTMVALAPSIYI